MHHTETTLKSSIGESIFVRQWSPEGEVRGAALLAHGVYEHSGRYEHVAERFTRHGYLTWAMDHYGHGKSAGPRGDIQNPNHFIADVRIAIEALTKEARRTPILLGHSMGGAIAALYAVRHPETLRALVLSSPALRALASPAMIRFGRLASRIAPTAAAPAGLPEAATHSLEWEDFKRNDPLKHERMTLRLARFIVDAGQEARRRAPELRRPVLMLVAGDDHFVDKRGAVEFFQRLKPGIGEYHEYDGYYHEVFNELERERPLSDLETWLEALT